MVLPTSAVIAGSLVLITVIRDVFTNGFPEDEKKWEIILDSGSRLEVFPWDKDDEQWTTVMHTLFPPTMFSLEKKL